MLLLAATGSRSSRKTIAGFIMEAKLENSLILYVSLTVAFTGVSGSNILFHPLVGEGSHYNVQKNIAVELIRRGHNVTVLMDEKFEYPVKADGKNEGFNVEIFKSLITLHEYKQWFAKMTSAGLKGKNVEFMMEVFKTDYMQKQVDDCHNLFGNKDIVSNLKRANFDMAIADPSIMCPFVQYLKLPHIMVAPALTSTFASSVVMRSPFNPSYMPEFTTDLGDKMSFIDRLKNTGYVILYSLFMSGYGTFSTSVRYLWHGG